MAAIDWKREPDERERLALTLLPRNGLTADGVEWLAALVSHGSLDTLGFMVARGWVLFTYGISGSRAAISWRGMDAIYGTRPARAENHVQP